MILILPAYRSSVVGNEIPQFLKCTSDYKNLVDTFEKKAPIALSAGIKGLMEKNNITLLAEEGMTEHEKPCFISVIYEEHIQLALNLSCPS